MQRVAIARAMINKPKIILADEPTGNLDSTNANQVFQVMQQLALQTLTSILLVTHSSYLAAKADKILVLKDGVLHQLEKGNKV